MTGVMVWRCQRGHDSFPRRLICPQCGSAAFVTHVVADGHVEDVTYAPGRGVRIVTVRAGEGVLLIGRADTEVRRGDRVLLNGRDEATATVTVPDGGAGAAVESASVR